MEILIPSATLREIELGENNPTHKIITALYKFFGYDIKVDDYSRYFLSDCNEKLKDCRLSNNITVATISQMLGFCHTTYNKLESSTNITI